MNVTKYTSQTYKIYRQQMSSFKLQMHYKKAELSQRWPRDAPYSMGALKIFDWVRPRLRNFKWAFVPIAHMKFEIRSFTRSWDNRGYSNFFGQFLDTPTLPFLKKSLPITVRNGQSYGLNGLLFGWTLWMYQSNLTLPIPEKISLAIEVLVVVAILRNRRP